MRRIEVTLLEDELAELIKFIEGTDVSPTILFKLASALGVLDRVYESDEGELIRQLSLTLSNDDVAKLADFALNLYQIPR